MQRQAARQERIMKKTISILLITVFVLTCFTGCESSLFGSDDANTVMTIDGRAVSWNEYMYWLYSASQELQGYYASAGSNDIKWTDSFMFDPTVTNAEWCVKRADQTVTEVSVIRNLADEKGITIDAEDQAEIDEYISQYIAYYCGEDATEADFEKLLNTQFLTLDYYRDMMSMNVIYQNLFNSEYGENGENLSDDIALAYGEENNYVTAIHILFKTVDDERNELDEATVAEKKAKAEALDAELKAITDKDELLAKFKEYMNDISEDPGKTYMPDGYCFSTGVMVEVFDTATRALDEYEVSDVVESEHGFHIIMRLPQNLDITVSSSSTSGSLRYLAASEQFSGVISELVKNAERKPVGEYKDYDFTTLFSNDGFAGWLMTDTANAPAESAAPAENTSPEESTAPKE